MGAAYQALNGNMPSGDGSVATPNTKSGRQRFARYRELARKRDRGVHNAWGGTCLERFTKRGRSGSAERS